MAQYTFFGKVIPEFKQFTLSGQVSMQWKDVIDPPVCLEMEAHLSINRGQVEIACESNLFGTDNYDGHVDIRANHLARTVVNSYGFVKGLRLWVILETVIKPDGVLYNIQSYRSNLEALVTIVRPASDGGVNIYTLLNLLKDSALYVAMNDLVSGIESHETVVACGRVVDAIRNMMAPASDRNQGWPVMREKLNFTESFLKFITDQSKGPRHGDVLDMEFEKINETIRRSWIVMNRFLEFRNRGNNSLPLQEFPLLDA